MVMSLSVYSSVGCKVRVMATTQPPVLIFTVYDLSKTPSSSLFPPTSSLLPLPSFLSTCFGLLTPNLRFKETQIL